MRQDRTRLASAEIIGRLRLAHAPNLPEDTQRTIAARLMAGSTKDAGKRLFLSPRAYRDHLAAAEDIVLAPTGLMRDVAYITLWFMLHLECCTAFGWMLIEASAVFPAEMT